MRIFRKSTFWTWDRVLYALVWVGLTIFYGLRGVQTLKYWAWMETWQIYPGPLYLFLSGIVFFLLGVWGCFLLLRYKRSAYGRVRVLLMIYLVWLWVDQCLISRVPDRIESLPFLVIGTLGIGCWTVLFFRKESFHDEVH
jgi:hypothetical protein